MLEGFHIQKGNSLEEFFSSTYRLMLFKKCMSVFLSVLNDITRYQTKTQKTHEKIIVKFKEPLTKHKYHWIMNSKKHLKY